MYHWKRDATLIPTVNISFPKNVTLLINPLSKLMNLHPIFSSLNNPLRTVKMRDAILVAHSGSQDLGSIVYACKTYYFHASARLFSIIMPDPEEKVLLHLGFELGETSDTDSDSDSDNDDYGEVGETEGREEEDGVDGAATRQKVVYFIVRVCTLERSHSYVMS